MNTLFCKDVRNKNLTTYNKMVKMMWNEIVNDKMIDHNNRAA